MFNDTLKGINVGREGSQKVSTELKFMSYMWPTQIQYHACLDNPGISGPEYL